MLDYRFPTALQMVLSVAMAEQSGERSTSAILAYGLEANPSFIRKLMVPSRPRRHYRLHAWPQRLYSPWPPGGRDYPA